MPQIAGVRGVLPDPSKAKDMFAPTAPPLDVAKGLASGALTRDPIRAIYRYQQAFDAGNHRTVVRKMLVCAVRLESWAENIVRPLEATAAPGKAAALAALRQTRATQPILAGYRDPSGEVERLFRRVDTDRATLELDTPDGVKHRVTRVQNAELFGQLRRVLAPIKLGVLDGHDRYEALLDYRDELGAKLSLAQYSSANYALMALVSLSDPALFVAARHKLVKGAPPSATVLAAARPYFIVEKLAGAAKDVAKQQAALADRVAHQPAFVVTWAGEPDAWKLTLSPDVSPVAEGVQIDRALQKYDPVIVEQLFVAKTMPGAVLDTCVRADEALAAKADAVILMRPLTHEQIGHVFDTGHVVPAGSTAFVPPIVPGLVSAVIDPDEDLV